MVALYSSSTHNYYPDQQSQYNKHHEPLSYISPEQCYHVSSISDLSPISGIL